jgi:molecular chaperone GrpE
MTDHDAFRSGSRPNADDEPATEPVFGDVDDQADLAGDASAAAAAAGAGAAAGSDDELSSITVMDALIAERDEMRAVAMRLQADFENFRKRIAGQHESDLDRATGRLAEAFLPVLDAAEAAFLRHPDEVGPLLNVMLGELKKHGLETLDLDGQPFDPEVAEAVAHEPGGGGDVVVAEVLRSGYRWRGKTLRPAMVRTTDSTSSGEVEP